MKLHKVLNKGFSMSVLLLIVGSGCAGGGSTEPVGMTGGSVQSGIQAMQADRAVPAIPGIPAGGGLTELLVQKLGVSQTQATGGAGSIFQFAKSQMQAAAFSKLSNSVPGMQGLLAAAPVVQPSSGSGLGGLAGRLAGLTGHSGGAAGNLLGLASSFNQLGLSPSMMQRFVPIVLQYVQGSGGAGTSQLLQSALMGGM